MTPPCLILAAGFGTRMKALTKDRPKPLIKVAGKTLLDHALDVAQGAGISSVAVNGHYRADQIAAHLADKDVRFVEEQPDILDSGGAIKNAMHQTDARVLATLNADNVWAGPNPLSTLCAHFEAAKMGALLLLTAVDHAVGRDYGDDLSMDREGRLGFGKPDGPFVYTGAQILDPTPAVTDPRDVFSLRDVWADLASEGRLFGLVYPGRWADVGHPGGIAEAEAMVAQYV